MRVSNAILLAFGALALRVTWVACASVTPVSDFAGYEQHAVAWLNTGTFGVAGNLAYRTPGYPALIAATYAVVGEHPKGVGYVQAALGALSCLLLVLIVGRFASPRAALTAAVLLAVSPTALAYTPVLASENLSTPVMLLGLLLVDNSRRAEGGRALTWSAGAGVVFGLLMLVRPAAIFLAPAFVLLVFVGGGQGKDSRGWHNRPARTG
ncbi:MAG: glycosyltransferase family 39 protein [Phycisphaerales bacterium]|nr:glycosyltransferase family 39 protein [Phycisphaerales bacterium]